MQEKIRTESIPSISSVCSDFAAQFGAGLYGACVGMCYEDDLNNEMKPILSGALRLYVSDLTHGAFCLAGGKDGLQNGGSRFDQNSRNSFLARMRSELEKQEPRKSPKKEFNASTIIPSYVYSMDANEESFFTRMLYSCILDAERVVGERILGNPGTVSLSDLIIGEKFIRTLSLKRKGVYSFDIGNDTTIFDSIVPEAVTMASSMHAGQIFFVVPTISHGELLANKLKNEFGRSNVGESYLAAGFNRDVALDLDSEIWDQPIVVTTASNLFRSLFDNKAANCRKLHHLVNSVIVMQNINALPLNYLEPCTFALSQLVSRYDASVFLGTSSYVFCEDQFKKYGIDVFEMIDRTNENKQVPYIVDAEVSLEDLSKELSLQDQVLCIVNSKEAAFNLFDSLPEEGKFCLTSHMCGPHREDVAKDILSRVQSNKVCRVISTTAIDNIPLLNRPLFNSVYREINGLDIVAHCTKYCDNRNASIHIVIPTWHIPWFFSMQVSAAKTTLRGITEGKNIENLVRKYFLTLKLFQRDRYDEKHVLSDFANGTAKSGMFPFREISERIDFIEERKSIVYINYENEKNNLPIYVFDEQFQALCDDGALKVIHPNEGVLTDSKLYDLRAGLNLTAQN